MRTAGIDVSNNNGIIDWQKVAAFGKQFAMIRAGYGDSITQKDRSFERNITEALAAGLDVGVYWASYAVSEADAAKEVDVFLQVIAPYKGKIKYPCAYDFEGFSVEYAASQGVTITKQMATRFAQIFKQKMNAAGWYAINYTNRDFYQRYFDSAAIGMELWVAYPGHSAPFTDAAIWQYGAAHVDGIVTVCDLDDCFVDYPTILANAGWNGLRPEAGWVQDANGWWYREADGSYPVNQWKWITDAWYYFGADGYMKTGWIQWDGGWYYLDPASGRMRTGWILIGKEWYYLLSNGRMATGLLILDNKAYYLKENGVLSVLDKVTLSANASGELQ